MTRGQEIGAWAVFTLGVVIPWALCVLVRLS